MTILLSCIGCLTNLWMFLSGCLGLPYMVRYRLGTIWKRSPTMPNVATSKIVLHGRG